ncbi:hypothetical protein MSAN_01361600 [Mycena sanguinolenta]|uniref:Coenzyme Q-binding protein COQ10 START domain-containing protein n=1 Tax=Mycena sanguinolenta TaxID=230812 RepID=A0A8H6YGP5_9AGAR|nr:hypothetical protein MSAN_01361600 [Mycena sanguinolenta]
MSGVPPLRPSGVFSVGESVLIDAPREKVWQILMDLPSYGKWNPFTRKMTIVSESGSPVDDQTLAVGKVFDSAVNIPPEMAPPRMNGLSRVTTLDHENFRAGWETPAGLSTWFFFYQRWTELTVEDAKTKWETFEVYSGPMAYVVYWLMYKNMLVSLKAMAEALKSRAEAD